MHIQPRHNLTPRSSLPTPCRRDWPRHPAASMTAEVLHCFGMVGPNSTHGDFSEAESKRRDEIRMVSQADPSFSEPLVGLVAANLVVGGMASGSFAGDLALLGRHLEETYGTVPELSYQALSFAILCQRHPQGQVRSGAIDRMDAVYARMCRRRWWITVAQDIPLAALLSSVNAPADHIDLDCERTFTGLTANGYPVGLSSQIAACVLCLLPIPQDQSFQRFQDLAHAFSHSGFSHRLPPAELSMLCLLNHDPDLIARRYCDIHAEMGPSGTGQPPGPSDVMLMIGRTFIECVSCDRSLGGMSARTAHLQQQHLLRDFLACTCAVAMESMQAQAVHAA